MKHTKWEHLIEILDYRNLQKVMNNLGEEGWEIVTIMRRDDSLGLDYLLFFKRPKE